MADIQPTDQFLVNRSDSTQTVDHADLMASLQDTDLMLINRSDQTYTITGEDLKDSLKPELTLTVVLSTYDAEVGDEITATGVAGGGTPPYTYAYQWQRAGVDIAGATNQKYTPVVADVGSKLKCVVTATDDDGDDITAASPETNDVVETSRPPVVSGAILSGGPGFSGKTYTTTLQGYDPGIPAATQGFKAKVTGALSLPGETSEITGVSTTNVDYAAVTTVDPEAAGASGNIAQMFDGDLSTFFSVGNFAGTNGPGKIYIPGVVVNSSLRIYLGFNKDASKLNLKMKDKAVESFGVMSTGWNDITSVGELEYIENYDGQKYTWIYAIEVDGQILIDGDLTTLTLTDDTNLRNGAFQTGDTVVQSIPADAGIAVEVSDVDAYGWYDQNEVAQPLSTVNDAVKQNFFNSNLNDNNKLGNKGVYISAVDQYIEFSYSNATVGDKIKIVLGSPSSTAVNYQFKANVTGNVDETGTSVLLPTQSNVDKNTLPKYEIEFTVSGTSGTLKIESIENDLGGSSDVYYHWWSGANRVSGTVEGISFSKDLPVTPVSSEITAIDSVSGTAVYSADVIAGSSYSGNEWSKAFNGSEDLPGASGQNDSGSGVPWNASTVDVSQLGVVGEIKVRIYKAASGTWGFNGQEADATNTTYVSGSIGNTSDPFVYILKTDRLNTISINGNVQLLAVYQNDNILIDGTPYSFTDLTLQNDKDLDVFQPGDLVSGIEGSGFEVTPTWVDPSDRNQWLSNINGSLQAYTLSSATYSWSGLTPYQRVYMLVYETDASDGWSQCLNGGDFSDITEDLANLQQQVNQGTPGNLEGLPVVTGQGKIIHFTPKTTSGSVTFSCTANGLFWYGMDHYGDTAKILSIDAAAPSMTTDGGTWSTGEVVTGLERLVPTPGNYMDLSNATAGWTVGERAINTVANPVTIKPLTSEIVGVEEGIAYVTGTPDVSLPDGTFPGNPTTIVEVVPTETQFSNTGVANGPYVMFDGTDTYSYMVTANTSVTEFQVSLEACGAVPGDLWGTLSTCGGSAPSYYPWSFIFCDADHNEIGEYQALATRTDTTLHWVDAPIPADSKYVKYKGVLLDTSFCQSVIAGFRVNGTTLVSYGNGAVLTFSDDTDLGQFVASDDVYQDGGYQPQSSAITGISAAGTSRLFMSSTPPANLADALTKTEVTYGDTPNLETDQYLIVVPTPGLTGPAFSANGQAGFYINSATNQGGHYDADGNLLGGYGNYNSVEWIAQNYTNDASTDLDTPYIIPTFTGGYTLMKQSTSTGTIGTITGSTTLTLTDTDDLENFRVGDSVGAGGTINAFAPVLYKGNGTSQSIDVGFAPDLVWIKQRTAATNHNLYDTIRGNDVFLASDEAEPNRTGGGEGASFTANGFSVGNISMVNQLDGDFVAWCWKASGSGPIVVNNDGVIESQVRVGNDFSICKYTGDGAGVSSFGHGLGKMPAFVIVKGTSSSTWWTVWHKDLLSTESLFLNEGTAASVFENRWGTMTDKVVGFGASSNDNNVDGTDFIAYCWAETSGVSSFGSYTADGSTVEIDCGFEPAFVIIKSSSNGTDWMMYDNQRGQGNLRSNKSDTESTQAENTVNLTSTGFEVLYDASGSVNAYTNSYIYAAFAGGVGGTITDITDNTMTLTDASGFEAGQTVTGPETTAATGIVASTDPAAKTMTLSTSDETPPKRWIANGGRRVTMDEKPQVESTAFLEFSGTQVTGLTSADPGYKPADPSLELTFTDPAPTGNTWDSELPAGTYMQTRVLATNDSGTADTGWSNRAVGRGLSPSADMEAAYVDASVRLLTHSNRACIYQGQRAQEAREEARAKIAEDMGITVEDLDDLVDGES